MRTLLLILLYNTSFGQAIDPAQVYSLHTRLGMNGRIKHVTAYKYTNLKYTKGKESEATGTLYSVIKNWYDSTGLITHDSTAIFYNTQSAFGYCKDYTYAKQDSTEVILVNTRFDCMPPYDNKAVDPTIVELTIPNDSTILAREYSGTALSKKRKAVVSSYRFTMRDSLLHKTVFDAYKKGKHHYGTSTYRYDSYKNFTHTTLTIGETPQQTIQHTVSLIDDYGNALRMLNYVDDNPEPEFMTVYDFEYYD